MIKVVPWGAGNVGKYAVQAVITYPELELIGHIVSSTDEGGKDVADLVRLDKATQALSRAMMLMLCLHLKLIVFVAHESGMVAALDLAKITGRGLYKSA